MRALEGRLAVVSDEVGLATPEPDVPHRGLHVVDFESPGVRSEMVAKPHTRRGGAQSQPIGISWAKRGPLEFVGQVDITSGLKWETNRFVVRPTQGLDRVLKTRLGTLGKLHSQVAGIDRQASLLGL